jgi:hypothetical protein
MDRIGSAKDTPPPYRLALFLHSHLTQEHVELTMKFRSSRRFFLRAQISQFLPVAWDWLCPGFRMRAESWRVFFDVAETCATWWSHIEESVSCIFFQLWSQSCGSVMTVLHIGD